MKQQPRAQQQDDRRIRRNWSIHPAVSPTGNTPLVAVKLGTLQEIFIPHGTAIAIANALTDCVEQGTTHIYSKGTP